MRLATALATALMLATLTGGSASGAEPVVAKLRAAIEKKVKFVAGGTIFQCEGTQCVAALPNYRTITLEACKQLSRRFGAIESLGDARRSLSAEKLATCNGSRA
ncbi:MAG: hypothetical protein EPO51_14585 [Phenylobacterium sp.]|jgi:hypothetical protein|uniref:CC_3452 family protein n=1 Tax=Phenylobacterium sp. TaxID=1871053 RepID=UPI001220E3DF|nr:hypothetical protein [Phenylobacterium sp.]TAJ71503.1 MAG: hypothetical protein EPO51_14585 [Phenylobacterium sp.]